MLELFFGVIDTVMSGNYFRIVLEIGFCVAFMFGLQKMFEKIGEESWKAFVPVYNVYVLSTHVWKPKMFVVYLIAEVASILYALFQIGLPTNDNPFSIFAWLASFAFSLVMFVFDFILCMNVSKAFGRQAGTAIGLFILNFVFIPILGYGEAKYVGNPNAPKDTGEA